MRLRTLASRSIDEEEGIDQAFRSIIRSTIIIGVIIAGKRPAQSILLGSSSPFLELIPIHLKTD